MRFFSATAETAWRLLEAGIGFTVSWPDDDSGHAVAIVGMDRAAGVALAHDPTSLRTAEYLLRAFDASASPYGVLGMAAVRMERAAELDAMLPREAAIVEAAQAQQKALRLYGPSAARAALEAVTREFPDHPATLELAAIQDLEEGRSGQALASFRALLDRFPRDPRLRSSLIVALRTLGDTALLRESLRSIVETGTIAGVQSTIDWVRPHPRYVAEYADLLRFSVATRREAETLLRSTLRMNWQFAQGWHILADLRWDQRRVREALIAYSIASLLAPNNEHYARAMVDVLAHEGRLEEGLARLEERAQRAGGSLEGVSAWITWIGVLEDRGFPERALAAYAQAAGLHGDSVAWLRFAAPFLAGMGRFQEGREQLDKLASSEGRAAFHEAAVAFHRMRGEPRVALEHAEAWVAELPQSMAARYALLGLLRTLEGNGSAAARAQEWMRAHPANESFEEAFCEYAGDRLNWRKIRVLRQRVRRNRDDGWAWRELIFAALTCYEKADAGRKLRVTPRIEAWLQEGGRTGQDHVSFLRAQALWQESRAQWRSAIDGYVEAIRLDPENFFSYRRVWDCSARLPETERAELWSALEPAYLEIAGPLPNALDMMGLLAGRLGVAETESIVSGWRARRPDDPNVLEAAADLLVERTGGRTASSRALELLEAAVRRFPNHSGLRFSLARAYRGAGQDERAHNVFTELVERQPNNGAALVNLAWLEHREGDTARALATLERGRLLAPHDPQPLDQKAQILIDSGRGDEAVAVIEEMMRSIPDSVQTYEWAIARFRRCGLRERAVEAARAGTRAFPNGAYLWLLLGRTLNEDTEFAAAGEVEECLRRSLKLNAGLHEPADWLAILLVEQQRQAEAAALIREVELLMPDPSAAHGRLAWIRRAGGETKAAAADLAQVVANAPWYAWGWNLLLSWLSEDKDWEAAKRMLAVIPPAMLSDTGFRQKRLDLLEQAGADRAVTEPEWLALLEDLPGDAPLHLRRFDALKKAGRMNEGAEVLRRMLPAEQENVYLRARLVEVDCHEKNDAAALDDALLVCFRTVEESEWPAKHVWERMRAAGLSKELHARFRAQLQRGMQPVASALALYTEDLLSRHSQPPEWFRQSWLNPNLLRVHAFVRLLGRSDWIQPEHLASLMAALNKHGYRRMALGCWRRPRTQGLHANTAAWAQAGSAMINLRKMRGARVLFADWKTRPGVKMWMLANSVIALPRYTASGRAKVIETCEDGLTTLVHDHCARHLAYMAAEAYALNRDRAGLLKTWERYANYFQGAPEKSDFFPQWQRYLLEELPAAVRRLSDPGEAGYWGIWLKLRFHRLWNSSTRRRVWLAVVFLLRLLVFFVASAGVWKELLR